MKTLKKVCSNIYLIFIFVLLYAPILTLMVLSFNQSKSRARWGGFTTQWYTELFQNEEILLAFRNTMIIAFLSALIATLIGLCACMAMNNMKKRWRSIFMGIANIPMLNADIVTGIAIMLLFVRFMKLGYTSMLIGHVTLGIPYVILNVNPRLRSASKTTYEAALDLGAGPVYAFIKVVLPELMPGIMAGFLMAFTISLDDFIITYFTKGAGINTISTMLYQEVRRGINPEMYAMSTLLFLAILLILFVVNRIGAKQDEMKVY